MFGVFQNSGKLSFRLADSLQVFVLSNIHLQWVIVNFGLKTYLMSTRDKCIILDRPLPQGSIKYLDARTTPLTPPKSKLACA